MKKLAGFTIMELTIVMLISAIVITISYYSLFLIQSQFSWSQHKSEKINDFLLLNNMLEKDAEKASMIRDSADNILIINSEKRNVLYVFDSTKIERIIGDKSELLNIGGYIKNIHKVHDTLNLINELNIIVTLGKDSLEIRFSKNYAAKDLLQAEIP
jgi:prepilin-type N-terminal cleavage/methylation domain-containing protein